MQTVCLVLKKNALKLFQINMIKVCAFESLCIWKPVYRYENDMFKKKI